MYVERAMYSLRMSFWTVPRSTFRGTPTSSAAATYIARRTGAVALIVIDVLTRSSGMPCMTVRMSSRVLIATPTRPTSPRAIGLSESYPICVGRSNAMLKPVVPCDRRYRKRRFVSSEVPKPAYCRIVQRRPRYIVAWIPRVNGSSPGSPIRSRYRATSSSGGGATRSIAVPLPVRARATGSRGLLGFAGARRFATGRFPRVLACAMRSAASSEEDPLGIALRPQGAELPLRRPLRHPHPRRDPQVPRHVPPDLVDGDAGVRGLEEHLLRLRVEAVQAEVRDHRGRAAPRQARTLPAPRAVEVSRGREIVESLDELPSVLLEHDHRALRQAPDVIRAPAPGETDLRAPVVPDHGRVQVPVLVDLSAPDEADVDEARLQEEAEHLQQATEHEAPWDEARVADRERRALRARVDDAALEHHHTPRGRRRFREHPAEHRQPGADERDLPVPDLPRGADRHELRPRVALHGGGGRRVSSHSSPAHSGSASPGASRAGGPRASAGMRRGRRGRTPIRPPTSASPRGSRSAPRSPSGTPRRRRSIPGPGTDAPRRGPGRSRRRGSRGRGCGSGPCGSSHSGRSPPRSRGSASPRACPTGRPPSGPRPACSRRYRSAGRGSRSRPRGTRGGARPSRRSRTGRPPRAPSDGGTTRRSGGRTRGSTGSA